MKTEIKEFTQFNGENPIIPLTILKDWSYLLIAKDDKGNEWLGDVFNGFIKWIKK